MADRQRAQKILEVHLTHQNGIAHGQQHADGGSLSIGEDSAEHAAQHGGEQHHNGDQTQQRVDTVMHAGLFAAGGDLWPELTHDRGCDHESHHQDDTGHDTGGEQASHGEVARSQRIDDEAGAGRDQPAQRSAGRTGGRGKGVIILVAAALGHGQLAHGGHGGGRGAADRAKQSVGDDGSQIQTAREVADPFGTAVIQTLAHSGLKGEFTHQTEQRNDHIAVILCYCERNSAQTGQGKGDVVGGQEISHNAHQQHGDTHIHAQEQQHNQGDYSQSCQQS